LSNEALPPANGRRFCAGDILQIPPPIGSAGRVWSKKVAVAWLYSSLGNQPEIKRLFLESELFPWIFTARSTLYLVLRFASTSLSCRSRVVVVLFTLFKVALRGILQAIEHLLDVIIALELQSRLAGVVT
jgi:hypothetical protein